MADDHTPLRRMTAEIVAAYLSNNSVKREDLPGLIAATYGSLLVARRSVDRAGDALPAPAVPINKSVHRDYLISLEGGKHQKVLTAHLSRRGLSPVQYRAKWKLPRNYPMVAASYAASLSEKARA